MNPSVHKRVQKSSCPCQSTPNHSISLISLLILPSKMLIFVTFGPTKCLTHHVLLQTRHKSRFFILLYFNTVSVFVWHHLS